MLAFIIVFFALGTGDLFNSRASLGPGIYARLGVAGDNKRFPLRAILCFLMCIALGSLLFAALALLQRHARVCKMTADAAL